ncbi:MAG: hypothetical protein ACRELV_14930 [Longimicrobiales bacterium]
MTSEAVVRYARQDGLVRAAAVALGSAAVYFGVIGGLLWQVARAAGYTG